MSNPYGQNPYGQQQPPGAPQQPQPGYGYPQGGAQQPGPQQAGPQGYPQGGPIPGQQPGGGGQVPPGPPFYGQQAPPQRGGSKAKNIIRVVIGLAVVAAIIVAYISSQSDPDHAKAGDCMKGESAKSLTVVKCSDADAKYTVKKVVKGTTDGQTECAGTGATSYYYQEKGSDKFLLCLAPKS